MKYKDIIAAPESSKLYNVWTKMFVAANFFIYLLIALLPFYEPFTGNFYLTLYKIAGLFICSYLVFRRFKDGIEFKLIFVYTLWLVFVRIVDGGLLVEGVTGGIFDMVVCIAMIGFAVVLSPEERLKWLDVIAVIYCVAYTLLAAVCIFGTLSHIPEMNYLVEGTKLYEYLAGRLYVLGEICNSVGAWYFIACMFLLYLFFRYKKTVFRVLIAFSFIVCYLTLALTFSRSSMVSFSVSMGMLAVLIALHYRPQLSPVKKAVVVVVLMCICFFAAYKSFNISAVLVDKVTGSAAETEVYGDDEIFYESGINQDTIVVMSDRGFSSSGRVELWKAAIMSLFDEPTRIITGSADLISSEKTNRYIEENMPEEYAVYGDRPNHHNTYLEFLMRSGLPGFLLMMAFFVILVVKMIRIFFSSAEAMGLEIKVLTLMLTGIMIFNLFESAFFCLIRLNTVVFCIIAGYAIAYEKELQGKKAG